MFHFFIKPCGQLGVCWHNFSLEYLLQGAYLPEIQDVYDGHLITEILCTCCAQLIVELVEKFFDNIELKFDVIGAYDRGNRRCTHTLSIWRLLDHLSLEHSD